MENATISKARFNASAEMDLPLLPPGTRVLMWTSANEIPQFATTAPASIPWVATNACVTEALKSVPVTIAKTWTNVK